MVSWIASDTLTPALSLWAQTPGAAIRRPLAQNIS